MLMAWKESPKVFSISWFLTFSSVFAFWPVFKTSEEWILNKAQKELVDCGFARHLPQWWLTPSYKGSNHSLSLIHLILSSRNFFLLILGTCGRRPFSLWNEHSDFVIAIPNNNTHQQSFIHFILPTTMVVSWWYWWNFPLIAISTKQLELFIAVHGNRLCERTVGQIDKFK